MAKQVLVEYKFSLDREPSQKASAMLFCYFGKFLYSLLMAIYEWQFMDDDDLKSLFASKRRN
ncbi:hypothetical protein [Pseudanabaena sp. 'Roaring Creek']|uniref:hypothetical protein n=1 Tax=Pseudanabaena sp. 'Roaring Creek' TaxID=1681830 RepID=UPI0006D7D4BE|nr:hypothetical protein [Pseudanabaena sp. 'Roaring Creek']